MKTIYKYPIEITNKQIIEMPCNYKLLHVGLDPEGNPVLWAEVYTSSPTALVPIYVIGTGHPVPEETKHIGSFVQIPFVWHVYTNI